MNDCNFRNDAAPPVFEQIFKNARFAQGGNAVFEGKVTGIPKPFVSWTRKGAPLLGKEYFTPLSFILHFIITKKCRFTRIVL